MLFNSFQFLIFFLVAIFIYYLIAQRYRWIWLLFSSCVFYMAYKPGYILVIWAIVLIDYCAALLIERSVDQRRKKLLLAISLISNIGILAYFKYHNFLLESVEAIFDWSNHPRHFRMHELVLPLGLSFHTFQSMSYTIEVAKGRQKVEKHLGYFATYVFFFPQMVAGPIEKYATLGKELHKTIHFQYANISNGFRLMLYGLFVKVALADSLSVLVDPVFEHPEYYTTATLWISVFFFSIQIYADFLGYSTIAVGVASCLGIHLMDNFNHPYFSLNLIDFWKRWHISLTNWFREYVYFSLGGNRVNYFRWLRNILLIFALSGLWHGADWHYIWWGIAHGIFYLLETPLNGLAIKNKFIKVVMILSNFVLISWIWILFRAKDLKTAGFIFTNLFEKHEDKVFSEIPYKVFFLLIVFGAIEYFTRNKRFDQCLQNQSLVARWSTYTVLLFCVLLFCEIHSKPFIYFQF
ncbi:MAG TPA: MBOAT family O-acyltransferase [Cytophagaceae bacterium]|nr:MBOAT family O-acyltransferase [Cytophagaceae bacterium]